MQQLTPELVAAVVAAVLSLSFSYIPGLNTWFAGLTEDVKKAIMGALTIVAAIAIYALACIPSLGFPYVACPSGGFWELLATIAIALGVNQGTFGLTIKTKSVKAVKAAAVK